MNRVARYWVLSLLLVFSAEVLAEKAVVVYSGNLDGELEPCGCSEEGDLGGLRRRATTLDALREESPELIAVSSGGLIAVDFATDSIKNRYILQGMQLLGYDAIGVQWADLTQGIELLTPSALPFVASNWLDDTFLQVKSLMRPGIKLAYLQWLDPTASPYRKMPGATPRVSDSRDRLYAALMSAREKAMTTMVGTTLTLEQAASQLPMELIDILVIKAKYEKFGNPFIQGTTLVVQPGSRGMRLGRLDLKIDPSGRISSWSHLVIPMPNTLANSPKMVSWYSAYNAEVKTDYLRRVKDRKALNAGKSPYLGAQGCSQCHSNNHELMSNTDHAAAFAKLEQVGKSFDPNCLECHTLGLGKPGGYLDQYLTPHLANVQCESCHGPGRQHAESGGSPALIELAKPTASVCIQCHNPSHSPGFEFDSYWARIQHQKDTAAVKDQ